MIHLNRKSKTFFSRFHTRTHLPQMQQFNEYFPGQTIQNMCFLNLICSAQFRVNTTCSETDRCSLEEASVGMAHILFKFPEHEKEQHKEFSPLPLPHWYGSSVFPDERVIERQDESKRGTFLTEQRIIHMIIFTPAVFHLTEEAEAKKCESSFLLPLLAELWQHWHDNN